ncbi:MAG TPA: Ig-like domain-containing protein, partial [Xanthobacteraceae bacterium]
MIQNDQINAVEESTLEVDAADGVLANDTITSNGPLTVVEGLYRTTGGGQIYFSPDGSYDYVSAAGFSGTDSVQYTALDNSSNVAGTATLTIDVAASALQPFVSIGTQLGVRQVVTAGFPQVGNGVDTNATTPVPLTGGGYVITVDYLDQANGTTAQVQTYDANNNLVGTFNPGVPVHDLLTTALTDGDYVVGWATGDSPTETSQVELFDAAGTALAGPVTINVPGGGVGISKIAALPGGGFVALELGDNGQQLYAWSFNAAGIPDSQPYAIGPAPLSTQKLAVLPDGEIVVAQVENSDEVEVQRYDTHGNAIGGEILPPSDGNVIDPGSMSVTVMPNGGFAVSWESIISNSNPREELSHIQLVDANGNLVGNQAQTDFSYTTVFGAPLPRVTPLANGGFVASWRGIVDNGNTYEGVQAYNASGNAVGSLIEFSDLGAFGSTFARVFALSSGGFAVVLETADDTNSRQNLHIYDNDGNYVGDVRMEGAGDGSDFSNMSLANQPDGNTLVLYDVENDTLVSSRNTVQTLNLNDGLSTPSIQTGISFNENTTGTIPVVVSLPDPDGSEIVQWIDVAGVPSGWTLSDAGATVVFDGFDWKVIAGNVAHGGEIDLSLTPPANFVGSEALTVTAHVVDTGNGSQNQSIPVTFNVTVAAVTPEPGSTTADMIMRDSNNGNYEIFDLGNNTVLAAGLLGQVGTELQVAGLGGFFGTDTSDMILRDSNNGVFEIYDISNNTITNAVNVGQVGLEWSVSGFGDFSSRSGETDMLMRNSNTGVFELYDIRNNQITSAAPVGQVGLEWSVAGFGDFSTQPNESDMLMRNNNTGVFELYDIRNNQITSAAPVGQVGLEWSV